MSEKSPHIATLLAQLSDSYGLQGLVRDSLPETRSELSGVMANLLEYPLSAREQELVADVLITLIRQAEGEMRRVLAERLSKMEQVPLRLVLHLVNDEIKIAGPILQNSPILSDQDLVYIIKSQGPEYWQAIAARGSLSDFIIDMLADTREIGTALVLTQNDRIRLTSYALEIFTTIASEQGELAKPLLLREEMPPSLARRLYNHVGEELKNYIQAFYGVTHEEIIHAVDGVILDFVEAQPDTYTILPNVSEFMPGKEMVFTSENMFELGQLNLTIMMDTLKRGQIQNFISMFAVYTNLPARQIHDLLRQTGGRKLAILCRAHSMQKGDYSMIYLLTHRMRSSDRLVNHKELLAALTYYDRVRPETAKMVLERSQRAND